MKRKISIQTEMFNTGNEIKNLERAGVGGVNIFVGVVRDMNEGSPVSGLFLEHYPGMTEKQIGTIIDEAEDRWDLKAVTVIHRIGQLSLTDEIVFVGTSSPHRRDAFRATEFIIDYLKTRATFWKKETTTQGHRWLETRESDVEAAKTWQKP